MASDDATLKDEVRLMTEYGEEIISPSDLQGLVDLTKRELAASVGREISDYYGDLATERALFWLACIFAKVKTGEIDAPNFEIGELSVRQSSFSERHGIWVNNFWKYYHAMPGGSPYGLTNDLRPDRTYRFDN